METLIRCRILRHLIWVCTVCQLPFYGSPDYNGLINSHNNHPSRNKWTTVWQNIPSYVRTKMIQIILHSHTVWSVDLTVGKHRLISILPEHTSGGIFYNVMAPIYYIYPKYWDTLTPYHTCPKTWISPFLMCLTHCRLNELINSIYWKILISILGLSGYVN